MKKLIREDSTVIHQILQNVTFNLKIFKFREKKKR